MIDKVELKKVLEKKLGRKAKSSEIENAQTDVVLLIEVISEMLVDFDNRIKTLEK